MDLRSLEQLSNLALTMAKYPDMHDMVEKLDLLSFIFKICGKEFSMQIRINGLVSIWLLTYNQSIFQQLLGRQVLDMLIGFVKAKDTEFEVKEVSMQTLIHFALDSEAINTLIEKDIITVYESMEVIVNEKLSHDILTNLAWLFLTLSMNGIQGLAFLDHGVTRDMFLLACEPNNEQIRSIVNAGF